MYKRQDAERVIIAMGSVTEAAREAIDHLIAKGEKVGCLLYTSFRARFRRFDKPLWVLDWRDVGRLSVGRAPSLYQSYV